MAAAPACEGGKLRALGKYESGLARCEARVAAKNDPTLEMACEDKAHTEFEVAFGKAGTCAGMQSTCESKADACEAAIVGAVPDSNNGNDKCESSKRKAAGKLASGELGCYAQAAAQAVPFDAGCIGKAQTKFAAALEKAGACPDGGSLQSMTENDCVASVVTTNGGGMVTAVCGQVVVGFCGTFLCKWGSAEPFTPIAIAVDGSAPPNVYVADGANDNDNIQKFRSDGTLVTKWGSAGTGDGQFGFSGFYGGVAVDGAYVYVADGGNHRIQKFRSDGTFVIKWGSLGSGDGQFNTARGLAVDGVDGSGNVYVADGGLNSRIQKFRSSDGIFLTTWGSRGSGDGQFDIPYGVAVDGSGNVYVADLQLPLLTHRIHKFTSSRTFVTKWSVAIAFAFTGGVAVDGSGNVYVADTGNHRIQKFTSSGTFVTKWGSFGSGDGQFSGPYGVAVDGSGYVYVADTGNGRIQKFACP